MSSLSPTIEGFRAAFRRPSLTSAEIAWRWTFGATAAALVLFGCIEFLATVPVTRSNSVLLSTHQPLLVERAIAQMLRGMGNRAVLAALLVAFVLSASWVAAASIGRLVTVRALFEYFRTGTVSDESNGTWGFNTRPFRALIDLNFLRLALFLATILSFGGTAILASFVFSAPHPRPGLGFTLFSGLATLICIVGWSLNWWLSLAGIFAVRDGEEALSALSAAVAFFRKHRTSVSAVSTWTGLAHLVAFFTATSLISLPLAFIPVVPARLVIAAMLLITLIYFSVADWLYIARLAGYIFIVERSAELLMTPRRPPLPPQGIASSNITIDRDELILSDIPNAAFET